MPFSANWTNAGIRFGGYADGTDWVVVPTGGFIDNAGFAGNPAATHAWAVVGPRNGTGEKRDVVLFDVAARRKLGSIPFDRVTGETLLASRDGKRLYVVTCLQLWDVEPVRYIRTIPVAWLTYDELPDDIRSDKRSAYEAIRTACESLAPDAHGPPSLTAEKYTSDPARQGVSTIHWDFAEGVLSEIIWADDEQSFWVRTHGFWSWVGVDGASSPRIRLERTGMAYGMAVPYANGPRLVEPLEGRKARFLFGPWRGAAHGGYGSAVVEAPSPSSFRAVQVYAKGNDGWQDIDFDPSAIVMRIHAAVSAMQTVKIKLGSLSAPDCIKAIASFDRKLRGFLKEAMTQESIHFSFEVAGRSLGEGAFFQHVESNAPGAVPELRKLVGRLISAPVIDGVDGLPFCSGEWQLLGPAVKALGVLDRSALETVGKYGRMIDLEHEYYFAGTTLPAIARAHGWTAEMVDFALSMLLAGFNIGSPVWRDGGMGAAVAAGTSPEDFAAHVLKAIAQEGPLEESFRFGHRQVYLLWEEIAPLTPWEERMFAALDAAVPTYDFPES